jgi:hypothetical protein
MRGQRTCGPCHLDNPWAGPGDEGQEEAGDKRVEKTRKQNVVQQFFLLCELLAHFAEHI